MGGREVGLVLCLLAVVVVGEEIPDLPDIWKVVENSYDSSVMVTFPYLNPGVSMLVEELYDIPTLRGVVETSDHGKHSKTNYFTKSRQAFVVKSGFQCEVGGLLDHGGYHMVGWDYDSVESPEDNFVYGPSAMLRLVRDYSKIAEYKGEVEVRGIKADQWVLTTKENYTYEYAFATDLWTMPYGHTMDGVDLKAPLQVTVHGPQGDPWHPENDDIVQTVYYDYTVFRPYVDPSKLYKFEVEKGLDCKGRASLDESQKTPPAAPPMFEVFLETVIRPPGFATEDHTTILRAWMYYDKWRQLVRLDINPDQDAVMPKKSYKSIHDYNTGIDYHIDLMTGQCTIKALDPDQLGNQVGSTIVGNVIMADPDNLFHLDDTYMFNGQGETRGLKTSRWTSTRTDIVNVDTGENYKKAVVDYQFLADGTTDEGELSGRPLPVRVDVTVYMDNDTSHVLHYHTLNLLHMKTSFEAYNLNPFDVRECMNTPSQRTWLKITYAGKWEHGASQKPDEFKKILLDQITAGTDSSYVRFPEIQLDHANELVFATVLMLEPAPYHLQFKKLEDRKPTDVDTQLKLFVSDDDICAFECLRYDKFTCKSFYECRGLGKNCYMSNYKNSAGDPVHIAHECHHYSKQTIKNTKLQLPNWEVVLWIDTQIAEGKFHIRLEYQDHDGQTQDGDYYGILTEEEILADDPILVDMARTDFRVVDKHGMLKGKFTDQTLKKVSYAKCVASCDGQKGFLCETFSYCYGAQNCYLSGHVVEAPVPSNEIIRKTDCVIVSRSHLDDYEGVDGTVYVGDPKETIKMVLDPDRCAYLCDNATEFTCRSFNFCWDSFTCNLFEKRSVDIPDNMLNTSAPLCAHYSRNALVDFVKHDNQVLEGSRDRFLKQVSASYCADVCEAEPDYGCNGFDFCVDGEDVTCFLTADHYSDSGVIISNSPTCSHYSREYYDGNDRNAFAHTKSSKYIYGPGDMAGLGCSMLVISIAGTFGGVYAYNKFFKK